MTHMKIDDNLFLTDLKQKIEGFRDFIGSWAYIGDYNFVVDVGPASTVNELIMTLKGTGIKRLDYVLLTHIHLDHAGGIAEFTKAFPEAQVVCHERAIEHLVNPKKLWEGSKKVLGEIALSYGEMKPISESILISSDEFHNEEIRAINTPGHAIHHVSYVYDKYLFAGEVGGVFHSLGEELYQRPATPPRLYLEKALESIDKLLSLGKKEICFGHFGVHKDSLTMLERHRKQLLLWKEVIASQMKKSSEEDDFVERCIFELLSSDSSFVSFNHLDDDIKEREMYFIRNSIEGYTGYIRSTGA